MAKFYRFQPLAAKTCIFGVIPIFALAMTPAAILAHAGHGDEFKGGTEATQTAGSIQVDAETAKRLGIKVESVKRQQLAIGIKTTGQIETLPNKKVEVTAPITGTVVELLAKPGEKVSKGQTVAVLSSSELAQLRVDSVQKRAEAEPDLQKAQADLQLARENLERQQTLVAADLRQAQSQLNFAKERYNRDKELADKGGLPRRQAQEDATKLEEAKAAFAKAQSSLPVLEAQAQLKRALAGVEVAQSRIRLSSAGYEARLQQLSTRANAKGLVTVSAPISGTIADREITPGETVTAEAGSKPLMTILNDSSVFATANIYEKDLNQVKAGQRVLVKSASLPSRTFEGRIATIGSVVEGETRVVQVKAELDNSGGLLKPGMFAQMEVLTDKTPTAMLVIPSSAVVDANGKKVVYIQNGNAYQSAEVTLGQTSGEMVEVKSGLFEGDAIVTQRSPQLYAQSLRGGSTEGKSQKSEGESQKSDSAIQNSLPWWLVGTAGGVAIALGAFWLGRRTKPQLVPAAAGLGSVPEDSPNASLHKDYRVLDDIISEDAPQRNHHHATSHESDVKSQK